MWITSANTNRKLQRGKESIFLKGKEIKILRSEKDRQHYRGRREEFFSQFQVQYSGKMLKMINENSNKEL
jgi:hypothetical protein